MKAMKDLLRSSVIVSAFLLMTFAMSGCRPRAGHLATMYYNNGGTRESQESETGRERGRNRRERVPRQQYTIPSDGRSSSIPSRSTEHPSIPESTREGVMTAKEIFASCNPAVFILYNINASGTSGSQGSGFIISSDGVAVSCYHVFEGTRHYNVLIGDQPYEVGEIIVASKEDDIIVFRIRSNGESFSYIPLSSREPEVGDQIYTISSPQQMENSLASGMISQLRDEMHIQISAAVDHGSSGGVLLNDYGEAIGVIASKVEDTSADLNFAISIDVVKRLLQ
jgi:serine protease Do